MKLRSLPAATVWLIGAAFAVALVTGIGCKKQAPPAPSSPTAAGRPDAGTDGEAAGAAIGAAPPVAVPVKKARAALPGDLPGGKHIALLHSANLRGEYDAHPLGGLGRRAALTAEVARAVAGVIQVDVGDSLLPRIEPAPGEPPPDAGEVERRARLLAAGLGKLRLQGFVPGETDLQLGFARFKQLASLAKLPVLLANLKDAAGKRPFQPYRLIDVGGVKVGLFGVLTVAEADRKPLDDAKLTLTDALEAAQGAVSQMREDGAALVVGLCHLAGGMNEARNLAIALTGADVLVLGHDPQMLEDPELLGDLGSGGTAIVSAGERGRFIGRLDLHVMDDSYGFAVPRGLPGKLTGSWMDHEIVTLDPRWVSTPEMLALIAPYLRENRRRAEKKLPVGLSARAGTHGDLADSSKENWTYATTSACALCHEMQKKQFDGTSHAFSLATLERRARHRDPYCLGCHSTGFDVQGGTRNLETANKYFGAVGCESCHGPSVTHVRGQTKAGTTRQVPAEICLGCHRPEHSPEPFDMASALKEVLGPGHGG